MIDREFIYWALMGIAYQLLVLYIGVPLWHIVSYLLGGTTILFCFRLYLTRKGVIT